MNKKLILPITMLVIFTAGIMMIKNVAAVDTTNQRTSLIQSLANKFGLKESDVQSVFDQARTEKQTERHSRYVERLNQLVTDKKITEAQKNLIIAKHDELQANQEKERQALENWASQNDINLSYLMDSRGFDHGPGTMKGGW